MNVDFKRGITLIESIIYLALFAILFAVFTQYFFQTAESNVAALIKNELDRAVLHVDSHISESFYSANSINEGSSTFNSAQGSVFVNLESGTIQYFLSNGVIFVNRGVTPVPITSENYQVSNFTIERILSLDGSLAGVRISYNIQTNDGEITSSSVTNYLL